MTPEDRAAARALAGAGIPLFMAEPDPRHRTGYRLPIGWERGATADPWLVDELPEGWALCAVMGHGLDLVDLDPRNGGDLPTEVALPPALAVAETPSGGRHLFVLSLGLPSLDGVVPGLDYKGGDPTGGGRGFAFIAPTVRLSKVDGRPRAYRWTDPPRAERISKARLASDGSPGTTYGPLRAAILARREARATGEARLVPASVAAREWRTARERLIEDLRRWAASGWGGEAHAGLLAHTTHLARLWPDGAEGAYRDAFAAAGLAPDDDDLVKLDSALRAAVPDVVVPDSDLSAQDLFWAGGDGGVTAEPPKAPAPPDPIGRVEVGPFRFLDEEEAALIPVPDELIEGILYRGTKARLYGESTRGKTWVAMDQAACVANGIPWLGRFEVKQGPVLFVAAEGAPSFAPRMRTWALANGRRCAMRFWPEPVAIGGPHWDAFVQACEREGFALVVQDTQAAMTVGRKEDSNDDAGVVQDAWTQLVRSAAAPCSYSIHHTGWVEQGRPRGASAMFAGMDTELRLAEGRHGLVLVTEKQRYAEKLPPVGFRLVAEYGGLVVRPPDGVDHMFGDDHDVRVAALLAKVVRFVETGGSVGKAGYRTMHALLNRELRGSRDEPVTEAVAQDVARAYRRSIGTEV